MWWTSSVKLVGLILPKMKYFVPSEFCGPTAWWFRMRLWNFLTSAEEPSIQLFHSYPIHAFPMPDTGTTQQIDYDGWFHSTSIDKAGFSFPMIILHSTVSLPQKTGTEWFSGRRQRSEKEMKLLFRYFYWGQLFSYSHEPQYWKCDKWNSGSSFPVPFFHVRSMPPEADDPFLLVLRVSVWKVWLNWWPRIFPERHLVSKMPWEWGRRIVKKSLASRRSLQRSGGQLEVPWMQCWVWFMKSDLKARLITWLKDLELEMEISLDLIGLVVISSTRSPRPAQTNWKIREWTLSMNWWSFWTSSKTFCIQIIIQVRLV